MPKPIGKFKIRDCVRHIHCGDGCEFYIVKGINLLYVNDYDYVAYELMPFYLSGQKKTSERRLLPEFSLELVASPN